MSLTDAQAAFRQSPGRETALACMDAAIEEWERDYNHPNAYQDADKRLVAHMAEIRDWLMNATLEPRTYG